MKMFAATAKLGFLVLIAAFGSAAFAQTPEEEGRMLVAMNGTTLPADWQPASQVEEQAQADAVERDLVISAEEISRKLDEQLDDRLARKLEMAI